MGVLLGIVLAAGVLLVLASGSAPKRASRTSRLSALAARAGSPELRSFSIIAAMMAAATGGGLAVLVITAVPVAALLAASFGSAVPLAILRRRARQREGALRLAWPDAVDALISAVRAGVSLPEALVDLGTRGPAPLRDSFATFAINHRRGMGFAQAVAILRDDCADPVADRVTEALLAAHDLGGTQLGRLLGTLAGFLREDARTRGEIESRQSWTVSAARVAVAAPWLTLLAMAARPGSLSAFNSSAGAMVLLLSAALSLVAYQLMMRIAALPRPARVVS